MHLQLRTIYFFSILLFLLACSAKDVRLADPTTPEESAKQGVVAFGIYFYGDGDDTYPLVTGIHGYAPIVDVSLVEVTIVDHKNGQIETLPFLGKKFLKSTNGDNNEIFLSNYLRVNVNPIHAFILPDLRKNYSINGVSFWVLSYLGRRSKLFCPLNVRDSYKTLPLKPMAGKITFLGFFKLNGTLATNDDGSCSAETHGGFISGSSKPVLKKSEELEIINRVDAHAEFFYLEKKVEPKYAELKFLRDFIDVQKEGYWKIKAEERLAALGYKYENGFLIEVEAKKK